MSLIVAASTAFLPAVAQAHRAPTKLERAQIARAAIFADGGGELRPKVSNVVVSTVGPWAAATVSIYRKGHTKPEMVADDSFFKSGGKWFDTTIRDRTPSKAVAADLHVQGPGHASHRTNSANHRVHMVEYIGGGLLIFLLVAGAIRIATFSPQQRKEWEERLYRKRLLDAVEGIRAKL